MKNDNKKRSVRLRPAKSAVPDVAVPQRVEARGLFGHALEGHRPRLVLFVGMPTNSYAPIAALWFSALAAEGKATIALAYADGAPRLAPEILAALAEQGLDARRLIPRTLTPELLAAADLVVTLSSGRQPRLKLPKTTRRREHWTIPNPSVASAKASGAASRAAAKGGADRKGGAAARKRDALLDARALRDALRARVAMLVFSEGWGRPEISREDARVTRAKSFPRPSGFDTAGPFGSRAPSLPLGLVPEVTPGWFPSPSPVPTSLR